MHPGVVIGCIAAIAVGVAIIMYTILRTPKAPAKFGNVPSIDLGEEVPNEDETVTEETETTAEENAEDTEKDVPKDE